jgi:hypothetical protein
MEPQSTVSAKAEKAAGGRSLACQGREAIMALKEVNASTIEKMMDGAVYRIVKFNPPSEPIVGGPLDGTIALGGYRRVMPKKYNNLHDAKSAAVVFNDRRDGFQYKVEILLGEDRSEQN